MKETNWYEFQEKICEYFKSVGANAKTNVKIKGIRTSHNIDILVETKYLGQNLKWIIEAKKWKGNVSKLHVLALRTIVDDIGADKGFLISEKGFQKGAIESVKNTNITLKTFEELVATSQEIIEYKILESYKKRIDNINNRYWSHSKTIRKKYELRGELTDNPIIFSVFFILGTAKKAVEKGLANKYPIKLETNIKEKFGVNQADNFQQLTNWLNLNLNIVDERIFSAEIKMQENGDFKPILRNRK